MDTCQVCGSNGKGNPEKKIPQFSAANHLNQGSWNNEGMDSAKRNPFRLEQEMQPGLMGLENFPKRSAFFAYEGGCSQSYWLSIKGDLLVQ